MLVAGARHTPAGPRPRTKHGPRRSNYPCMQRALDAIGQMRGMVRGLVGKRLRRRALIAQGSEGLRWLPRWRPSLLRAFGARCAQPPESWPSRRGSRTRPPHPRWRARLRVPSSPRSAGSARDQSDQCDPPGRHGQLRADGDRAQPEEEQQPQRDPHDPADHECPLPPGGALVLPPLLHRLGHRRRRRPLRRGDVAGLGLPVVQRPLALLNGAFPFGDFTLPRIDQAHKCPLAARNRGCVAGNPRILGTARGQEATPCTCPRID